MISPFTQDELKAMREGCYCASCPYYAVGASNTHNTYCHHSKTLHHDDDDAFAPYPNWFCSEHPIFAARIKAEIEQRENATVVFQQSSAADALMVNLRDAEAERNKALEEVERLKRVIRNAAVDLFKGADHLVVADILREEASK